MGVLPHRDGTRLLLHLVPDPDLCFFERAFAAAAAPWGTQAETAIDFRNGRCHIGTMPAANPNSARVVARVPEKVRQVIQMAADLQGAALNQFLVQSAYKEARQILERETLIHLSETQAKQVFSLLENPPAPNARLKRAASLFKANVRV